MGVPGTDGMFDVTGVLVSPEGSEAGILVLRLPIIPATTTQFLPGLQRRASPYILFLF